MKMKKMLDEKALEKVTGGNLNSFGSSVERRDVFCYACNEWANYSTGDIYEDGLDWVADCKKCGEMVFWDLDCRK